MRHTIFSKTEINTATDDLNRFADELEKLAESFKTGLPFRDREAWVVNEEAVKVGSCSWSFWRSRDDGSV
jgi:hypothetical protein